MADEAVFPCVLRILPNPVFNKPNLLVLAVEVIDGTAKVGTPLCVPGKGLADIGKIASIERNHTQVEMATKGQMVVIKIIGSNDPDEQKKSYRAHLEMEDELAMSVITKRSTDLLKANHKDDLSLEDWSLVSKLNRIFGIYALRPYTEA